MSQLQSFLKTFKEIKKDNLITGDVNLEKGNNDYQYDGYFSNEYIVDMTNFKSSKPDFYYLVNNKTLPITSKYGKIVDAVYKFNEMNEFIINNISSLDTIFSKVKKDFEYLKSDFLNEFYYYAKIARGWGKILTMIYFCLLCIAVTFAGVSMMFYACLKRQGYLLTFMHVLWNIIRFFMFSFLFYGAAYGMLYLALRDAVAYVMYVFGEKNLDLNGKSYLIPTEEAKGYLYYCLINDDHDFKHTLSPILISALEDFFKSYSELKKIFSKPITEIYLDEDIAGNKDLDNFVLSHKSMINFIKNKLDPLCKDNVCGDFPGFTERNGGLFGFLDCSFLKSDLNMMYRTLYDLSVEARILCALSCCIGFFGAVFVYFFLLVLHHYNTEIFFDTGKSIFTGFEGYGNTKKKSHNDPSYKKRKIRSEIELSSRNEEYSYKLANKNEDRKSVV